MQRPRSSISLVDGVRPLGFQLVEHPLLKFMLAEVDLLWIELQWGLIRLFALLENRPRPLQSGGGDLRSNFRSYIPIQLVFSGQGLGSSRSVSGIAENRQA